MLPRDHNYYWKDAISGTKEHISRLAPDDVNREYLQAYIDSFEREVSILNSKLKHIDRKLRKPCKRRKLWK